MRLRQIEVCENHKGWNATKCPRCELATKDAEIAKLRDVLETIENDSKQVPTWLLDRIKKTLEETK